MARNVERTDVDGLPVFWAPAPGVFRATLMFRVGIADEAPATRGITHLVEHLAMFGSTARTYEANGFVAVRETDSAANEEKEPDVLYRWMRA